MPSSGPDIPDTTTTTNEPPAYVKPYLQNAAKSASNLSQIPFEYFPNQTYIGQNEFQDQGASQALAYGTSPAMMSQINNAMGAQQSMLAAPDVANNPYLTNIKNSNARLVGEQLQRNVMPGIQDQFVSRGGLGGSRQGIAEGLAASDAQKQIMDYNARIDAAGYGEGLAQQRAGMGFVPQTMGLGYMPAQAMSAFGQYANQDPQLSLQEQMSRFDFAQQEPWDRLNQAMAVYMGMPGSTTSATNPNAGMGTNPLMGLGGLGLQGASLYSMFNPATAGAMTGASAIPASMLFGGLSSGAAAGVGAASLIPAGADIAAMAMAAGMASDRRLKKNVVPIGQVGDHEWYAFEYKDGAYGEGLQIGVMADEVEQTKPGAVFTMANGYKAVDYAAL